MNALEFVLGFIALAVIWFFFGLIGLVTLALIISLVYAIDSKKHKSRPKESAYIDKMITEGYVLNVNTGKWEKPEEQRDSHKATSNNQSDI